MKTISGYFIPISSEFSMLFNSTKHGTNYILWFSLKKEFHNQLLNNLNNILK